jgi:hypothetical protein
MTTLEQILAQVKALPPELQKKRLALVEGIRANEPGPAPRKPLRGMWRHIGVDVSEDELADARREMWGSFPRAVASSLARTSRPTDVKRGGAALKTTPPRRWRERYAVRASRTDRASPSPL